MSRTVVATIVKTITLGGSRSEMSDSEIIDMFQEDVDNSSLDDWRWDDESTTLEVFPTQEVILGVDDEI